MILLELLQMYTKANRCRNTDNPLSKGAAKLWLANAKIYKAFANFKRGVLNGHRN